MRANHFFLASDQKKPLNKVQVLLLQYTQQQGMTAEILNSWRNSYTGFTIPHAEAVMYLMNEQQLTAEAAIREIDQLTENEAALIPDFYQHGLNREYILSNREQFAFDVSNFYDALSYLVKKQKLTFFMAMQELSYLNVGQIYMLQDLYAYGLRAQHFAQANMNNIYLKYAQLKANQDHAACRDAINYFRKIFKLSHRKYKTPSALRMAAMELSKIYHNTQNIEAADQQHLPNQQVTSKRIRFLLRSAYRGVRADDYPAEFNSEQNKTYYSLLIRHAVHKPEALQEMRDLSEDKIIFLRQYYGHGVNYKRLRHFPHHMNYVRRYMQQFKSGAVETLDSLAPLSHNALEYLYHLAAYGVTLQHVSVLPEDVEFFESRKDNVIDLIESKKIPPGDALYTAVMEANDKHIMMAEPARRNSV